MTCVGYPGAFDERIVLEKPIDTSWESLLLVYCGVHSFVLQCAHYLTRNRTGGSDFLPFSLRMTVLNIVRLCFHVCFRQGEKIGFLSLHEYDFS